MLLLRKMLWAFSILMLFLQCNGQINDIIDVLNIPSLDVLNIPSLSINEPGSETGSWPWCDATLGCLNITDDWYSTLKRPYNLVPSSRESIGTQFLIHTKKKRNVDFNHEVLANDPSTLDGTGFDAQKPTKFIIHGFVDNGYLKWIKEFAQELLDYGDYNVFRVNWGGGSLTLYGQAVANTRVVGLEIGYFVNWLVKYSGVNPADVHILGHSLGSHIAGYAGEQIPGLGRISGLDPAGPYFTNMPFFIRLDETDAIFVDNYHTDSVETTAGVLLGFGTTQAMGNIDFYPNGGRIQPGCSIVTTGIAFIKPGDIIGDTRQLAACSHQRAVDLYRESLKQSCPNTALECSSYLSFTLGRCGSCKDQNIRCSPIGIKASEYTHKERVNVRMYFDTEDKAPYFRLEPSCEDKNTTANPGRKDGGSRIRNILDRIF